MEITVELMHGGYFERYSSTTENTVAADYLMLESFPASKGLVPFEREKSPVSLLIRKQLGFPWWSSTALKMKNIILIGTE